MAIFQMESTQSGVKNIDTLKGGIASSIGLKSTNEHWCLYLYFPCLIAKQNTAPRQVDASLDYALCRARQPCQA
jgi:hypothetical protein